MEDGQKVVLQGDYGVRGTRAISANRACSGTAGRGGVAGEVRETQSKAAAEGLFDPERKRTLPRVTQRIGVVTSLSGRRCGMCCM